MDDPGCDLAGSKRYWSVDKARSDGMRCSHSRIERAPMSQATEIQRAPVPHEIDVVIVGAGFAGMYMLHRLRGLGLSAVVFDVANGVGGTWYWNRYPGARCESEH